MCAVFFEKTAETTPEQGPIDMQSRLLRHDQIGPDWQLAIRKAGQPAATKWQSCFSRRGRKLVERAIDEKVKNRSTPHGKPKII
jgi:hypothetical protein